MISVSHKISTSGMVTRVKILGEADDDKRRPVEATVDGQTKYGIRQKIITRAKDDSLDEAKKTAKRLLKMMENRKRKSRWLLLICQLSGKATLFI